VETSKCPKCNATIEKGVTICGNCKTQLSWDKGLPKVVIPTEAILTGCLDSLSSLGCLLTLFITIPILFSVCFLF